MPRLSLLTLLVLSVGFARAAEPGNDIRVTQTDDYIQIDTDALQRIRKKGYVSGVAAGTLLDKKTGARDIGFGLHIMDFLMAPGWADDGYPRNAKLHGNLPKHYIEGPQICTQAKELHPEVIEGKGFVAVRMSYRFTKPAAGLKAGSLWEQTLVFQPGLRYFLSGEASPASTTWTIFFIASTCRATSATTGTIRLAKSTLAITTTDPGLGVRRGLLAGREIPVSAQRR